MGEVVGRWAEGCPCHDHLLVRGFHVECQLKGCRAVELATGDSLKRMDSTFTQSRYKFMAFTATLEGHVKAELLEEWDIARSKVLAEVVVKLGHWRMLPHALCGIYHWDSEQSKQCAQHCLYLWSKGTPGCSHQMSRRFLDPSWNLNGEEPLRKFVIW